MTFNLIIKDRKQDRFSIPKKGSEKTLIFQSYKTGSHDRKFVDHNIAEILRIAKLNPSENAIDFINLSLAAYTADQLISRENYGHYGWSRYFKIFLPVLDINAWHSCKDEFENLLSFLSGDKWELYLREREAYYETHHRGKKNIDSVCLLSGGLDSFIGAVDALNDSDTIALVSHHKAGGGGELSTQAQLVHSLSQEYPDHKISPFYFYVQPNQSSNELGREDTQRARSLIYVALGLAVANSIGPDVPLRIPENGLISLNVPMTKTRLGSRSTRTTHPRFLAQLSELLSRLSIDNPLINPYRFQTKGEMIVNSENPEFVKTNVYKTISCAKPGYYVRWHKRQERHCGFCTPCIIRRAAMHKAEIDRFDGNYVYDVVHSPPSPTENRGRDYTAFKIGASRLFSGKKLAVFSLLQVGSIPGDEEDLREYAAVYKRGMREVLDFLDQN